MGRRKAEFLLNMQQSLANMRRGETVPVTGPGGESSRIIFDTWRCPAIVSDYERSDFANDLQPEDLDNLTSMVNEYSRLTQPFAELVPVPGNIARQVDSLLERIGDILAPQLNDQC